jgi:GrpB-like predicted nucleotidyltransferase (UPF0157 family)
LTISIVSYRPQWPEEFRSLAAVLHASLGNLALRIDHIGSTSVPGLAAKDRIDIQVTAAALTPALERAFQRAGYTRLENYNRDHVPPGADPDPQQWSKWLFQPPELQRPTNLHVRLQGRANQRYALLFRDYLRSHLEAAQAYAQVKMALAHDLRVDVDGYYAVKDPVCDIIMAGAELWAAQIGWHPGLLDA